MINNQKEKELIVTFQPPLHLQRQIWILDTLRKESIQTILDIGCGEGSLLRCLTEPSPSLPPSTSLPPSSPFVTGPVADSQADLYLKTIHGLDPSASDLAYAAQNTAPPSSDTRPFTGFDRWTRRDARWAPLEVNIWQGGFETLNPAFENDKVDAFVGCEVIEHIKPELFPLFAPVLLGHYRPRLLLLTTPNFTYNQRFTPPGKAGASLSGYPDPTGRTDRVFRHSDHKFEWTTEEWKAFCTGAAAQFGYAVDIDGIGLAVEPDPWNRDDKLGHATHVAVFRRKDVVPKPPTLKLPSSKMKLFAKHIYAPHPLSPEELRIPAKIDEIYASIKDAMTSNNLATLSFHDIWKHGEVSTKCRGDIGVLVRVLESAKVDLDSWLIEDEAEAWGMKVTWKHFMPAPISPQSSEVQPEWDFEQEQEDYAPEAVEADSGSAYEYNDMPVDIADNSWGWSSQSETASDWGWSTEEAAWKTPGYSSKALGEKSKQDDYSWAWASVP